MGLRKFKVKITKGHYEASTVDDLRRPGLSHAFFPSFLLFLPSIISTSNVSGQCFLSTSHSPHPLPLQRCKVNISIGLQWPVSTALIPTLLFEGSIVPDLLAWFACLWIMAKEPQSGLLPIYPFSHIYELQWYIYARGMESLLHPSPLNGQGCKRMYRYCHTAYTSA